MRSFSAACRLPAKSPLRKAGTIELSMIDCAVALEMYFAIPAELDSDAPFFIANATRMPLSRPRWPSFHEFATRNENDSMLSPDTVGTSSTAIW